MEIIIILAVWLMAVIFCIMGAIRSDRFSKFMHAEIDRVSKARLSGNKTPWPDVTASYRNLKWYDVFNYKFDRLVVYDVAY